MADAEKVITDDAVKTDETVVTDETVTTDDAVKTDEKNEGKKGKKDKDPKGKKDKDPKAEKAEKVLTYSKKQFVNSKKFAKRKDILNALLEDGKMYSIAQVEEIINDFLYGKKK